MSGTVGVILGYANLLRSSANRLSKMDGKNDSGRKPEAREGRKEWLNCERVGFLHSTDVRRNFAGVCSEFERGRCGNTNRLIYRKLVIESLDDDRQYECLGRAIRARATFGRHASLRGMSV